MDLAELPSETSLLWARLVEWFQGRGPVAVALSGGVDSAVVCAAAAAAAAKYDMPVVAVTSHSVSVPENDVVDARSTVAQLEIPHVYIDPAEMHDSNYVKNDKRRCFYCKFNLFSAIRRRYPGHSIVTGTNAGDLNDYRPGLQAADDFGVTAPLLELEIDKGTVRTLASFAQLEVAGKPASPCLASRIAYGVEVTAQRLKRVHAAEKLLHELGFDICRVRLHAGGRASVEVLRAKVPSLLTHPAYDRLMADMQELGFRSITVDEEGFRSGSLNKELVTQIELPRQ